LSQACKEQDVKDELVGRRQAGEQSAAGKKNPLQTGADFDNFKTI
jgi:hypothetical protein